MPFRIRALRIRLCHIGYPQSSRIKSAAGFEPSLFAKVCSTVSCPVLLTLNTTPQPALLLNGQLVFLLQISSGHGLCTRHRRESSDQQRQPDHDSEAHNNLLKNGSPGISFFCPYINVRKTESELAHGLEYFFVLPAAPCFATGGAKLPLWLKCRDFIDFRGKAG
jgi:hypothetical protein